MTENNGSKKNAPKFVGVYTKILQMIQDGIYAEGSKIPPEPELAKKMGVSRMTLRQALALLQEDGVVETIHGQGNFVRKTPDLKVEGLEKPGNPIYKCLGGRIDKVNTDYRLDVSDSYTNMIFNRETAVFIGVTRKYNIGNACVGFSFSYIPADIEELQKVDLNEEGRLSTFLDQEIYEKAYRGNIKIRVVGGNKDFKDEVPFEGENSYTWYIIETIVNAAGEILVYTKYSMPIDQVELQINQYY